jgi:hypothetical protein
VSCWDMCASPAMPYVTFEFACQVYETVGDGYSDHSCAKCVGTNVYFGPRYSFRP